MLELADPAELAFVEDRPVDHFTEMYCRKCGHEVDAVCPQCGAFVECRASSKRDMAHLGPLQTRLSGFLFNKRHRFCRWPGRCLSRQPLETLPANHSGTLPSNVPNAWNKTDWSIREFP